MPKTGAIKSRMERAANRNMGKENVQPPTTNVSADPPPGGRQAKQKARQVASTQGAAPKGARKRAASPSQVLPAAKKQAAMKSSGHRPISTKLNLNANVSAPKLSCKAPAIINSDDEDTCMAASNPSDHQQKKHEPNNGDESGDDSDPQAEVSDADQSDEPDDDLDGLDHAALRKKLAAERPHWGSNASAKTKASTIDDEEDPHASESEEEDVYPNGEYPPAFDELDDEPEYVMKQVRLQRALARMNEVPKWAACKEEGAEDTGPNGNASDTEDCGTHWPEEASYVPPQPGARNISLNSQPPQVQALIKAAIRHVTGDALFSDAYPATALADEYYRDILTSLATDMTFKELSHRLNTDKRLLRFVSRLLATRISNVRCGAKKITTPKIELSFQLSGNITDCKEQVKKLLTTGDYIYPRTETGLIRRTRPFNHAVIISSIRDYYFSGSRGSMADRHSHRFTSSMTDADPQRSELEVPATMVCMIATAVHASLQDWSGGFLRRTEFNSEANEDVYRGHLLFLNNIRRDNLPAYHRLLANIYKEVNASQSHSALAVANNSMAILDLEGMEV